MATRGTENQNKKLNLPVGFETDPEEDKQAREEITRARVLLLIKFPFFGNMATRLQVVNADKWLATLATDGRHLFYNSKFVLSLPQPELVFGLGHEVLHNCYDHLARRGGRKPQLSNIAADYCVNNDLIKDNIGQFIDTIPILIDRQYDDMSFEQVYEDLERRGKRGEIDLDELAQFVMDEHLDSEDDEEENQDADINKDQNGNMSSSQKPNYSKEERDKISDQIKQDILQSAQATSAAGDIPAGIARLIKEWQEAKIDWRELVAQQILSLVRENQSFATPNRKSQMLPFVLPGTTPQEIVEVDISIDTSGSISEDMLIDFLSEVKGVMDQFAAYKVRLWCFDTQVHAFAEFDEWSGDDILEYKPAGGGGTDFMCNWEFMKEEEIEPKKFIMFTDGYPFDSWGDPHYCDTVFIIHGSPEIKSPFGVSAYYDKAGIEYHN